jgi:DNA polymerase bacteriophage-type
VRLQASTTSVSKYATLTRATSADGRLRGLLQFDGAGRTGRWAGRTFQPQNLMRPNMKQKDIDFGIEAIKADACHLIFEDQMRVISNVIRGCLIAPPGRKEVVADLANIEGRVAAWLTGEIWKLKAFDAYDAGTGPDLYVVAYAKSFNVSHEVVIDNKEHGDGIMRQIGKVQELMLQYEGGVGAFVTGAATYRIDLNDLAEKALPNIPSDTLNDAREFLKWMQKKKSNTFGLPDDVFVTCESLKRLWRDGHPAISSYWSELKDAFMNATQNPGTVFTARMLKFRRDGAWLRIRLPSGRSLCYPSPEVNKGQCSYMGINAYTRKWERIKTYGGKLFENICQAVARDVMAYSMPEAEAAGYEVLLTVHDELITETPDTPEFNEEGLGAILATQPVWADGLPLAAAGFSGYRYKKG